MMLQSNQILVFAIIFLVQCISSQTPTPPNWVLCANEGEKCQIPLNSRAIVRYGFDYTWSYVRVENTPTVCDRTVFGNFNVTKKKKCYYTLDGTPTLPNEKMTFCADQNGVCQLGNWEKTYMVAYGSEGKFFYRLAQGQIQCKDSVFGNPNFLKQKSCYIVGLPIDYNNTWQLCGNDKYSCNLPNSQSQMLIRYGSPNEGFIDREVAGASFPCSSLFFGGDNWKSPNCYSLPGSPLFLNPVGRWEPQGSVNCNDGGTCRLDRMISEGVQFSKEHQISESWSKTLAWTVGIGFSFAGISTNVGVSGEDSHETSTLMGSSFTHLYSETCQVSCEVNSSTVYLFQWVMEVQETCSDGFCGLSTFSCNWVCKSNKQSPNCPLGCDPAAGCNSCLPPSQ